MALSGMWSKTDPKVGDAMGRAMGRAKSGVSGWKGDKGERRRRRGKKTTEKKGKEDKSWSPSLVFTPNLYFRFGANPYRQLSRPIHLFTYNYVTPSSRRVPRI